MGSTIRNRGSNSSGQLETVHYLSGNLVDLFLDEIYPAKISIAYGRIRSIQRTGTRSSIDHPHSSIDQCFIVPGLVDAHVHIESSMLTPSGFAGLAVPHGTTGVVADPHEIVNVAGLKGFSFMVEDAQHIPLKCYFTAPSCVPSTSLDPGGGRIGIQKVRELFERGAIGLGEVMDFPAVIERLPEIMGKIGVAHDLGRSVDGHAPGLTGNDLERYVQAGISTDHESLTLEEAMEKSRKGMIPIIREGSAAKGLAEFHPLIGKRKTFLCTDDMHPDDLMHSHIDGLVKQLLEYGHDIFSVLKAATIHPANHYGLDTGFIREGGPADLCIIDDPGKFNIQAVIINGQMVARHGKSLFTHHRSHFPAFIIPPTLSPDDFLLKIPVDLAPTIERVHVRVMEIKDHDLLTHQRICSLPVSDGNIVLADGSGKSNSGILDDSDSYDIVRAAVISRYGTDEIGLGFLNGTGLKNGAIAMSIAHDAHNFIVIGQDVVDMHRALELISETGGIACVMKKQTLTLPLPIAGIMTAEPSEEVIVTYERLRSMARIMGMKLVSPFISISFIGLPVIPEIRLTPRGYVDVIGQRFVHPVVIQ